MEPSELNNYKKSDVMLAALMGRFRKNGQNDGVGFEIGGEIICPTQRDLKLIFGIRDGTNAIQVGTISGDQKSFLDRCWPELRDTSFLLSRKLIVGMLKEKVDMVTTEPNVAEDVAKLVHMLLLSVLFMPNNNTSVGWKLTKHLEDFGQICSYDWSGYIFEGLMESMKKASTLKIPAGDLTHIYL